MQLAEIQTNKQISMTSLQIAELCDKRHDSVKRTIEILSKPTDKRRAVIARPHSVIVQNVANNRTYDIEVYVFSGEQGSLRQHHYRCSIKPTVYSRIGGTLG